MNFGQNLKFSIRALRHEDEISLAFLHGNKLDQLEHLKSRKKKYQGVIFRIVFFVKYVFSKFTIKNNLMASCQVLFYASTINQFNSFESTIIGLNKDECRYFVLLDEGAKSRKNEISFASHMEVKWSLQVVFAAILLLLLKGPSLWYRLKKQNKNTEIKNYFDVFCMAYAYICYFNDVVTKAKPDLVVVANDHSVKNRALRLVAELNKVKTLYLQHASVSHLFPPLEYDYALLDGVIAKDIYLKIYSGNENKSERIDINFSKCKIILTGQKKTVASIGKGTNKSSVIGVAVNALDEFSMVQCLLQKMIQLGERCIVRTHPYQSKEFNASLNEFIVKNPQITWSNSRVENLETFFDRIVCLIAGTSSIHLEAAISGLQTFHYEMASNVLYPDYYGYVKNGVSIMLEKDFDFQLFKDSIKLVNDPVRESAIRLYSSTFRTKWQGREGDLVASIVKEIVNKQPHTADIYIGI